MERRRGEPFDRVAGRLGKRIGRRTGEGHGPREPVEEIALIERIDGLEGYEAHPIDAARQVESALSDRLAEGIAAHDRDLDPRADGVDVELARRRRRLGGEKGNAHWRN